MYWNITKSSLFYIVLDPHVCVFEIGKWHHISQTGNNQTETLSRIFVLVRSELLIDVLLRFMQMQPLECLQ